MSKLDLSNITAENYMQLGSSAQVSQFFLVSQNDRERAENFSIIMNKAKEFGVAEEVAETYQEAARAEGIPELWEIPEPFGKVAKLSPFPLSCLPEMLSEYLKAVTKYVQVFPEMAVLPLLSVLSLCVQDKAVVKHPGSDHTEPLNLYTMTIAAPGERKTGSFKQFMKPVKEYEEYYNTVNKYRIDEYTATKEYLEGQKRSYITGKKADLEKAKQVTRELADLEPVHELKLNVSDATPEALAWEMYLQGGKIGVLGDEGAIFDVLSGLYSNGASNLNIFLEAYDGSDYSIIRRTKENIDLKNPLLTMGLMVQPDLFIQAMNNRAFAGRGFIHRFLFSLQAATALERQVREVVIPEVDSYIYGVMCTSAGTKATAKALTKTNIYEEVLAGNQVLDDANVPETGRILLVTPATYTLMKQCKDITMETDIGNDMRLKGVIGMLDGCSVIKVPSARLPEAFGFMIAHPSATVAPTKLEDYKVHEDPPGISGSLVEGRINYDAFVLDNKAKGIYYQPIAKA